MAKLPLGVSAVMFVGLFLGHFGLGGFITFLIVYFANVVPENAFGLMSDAVTNTPGLGAAKATLQEIQSQFPDRIIIDPTVAYTITYSMGF